MERALWNMVPAEANSCRTDTTSWHYMLALAEIYWNKQKIIKKLP